MWHKGKKESGLSLCQKSGADIRGEALCAREGDKLWTRLANHYGNTCQWPEAVGSHFTPSVVRWLAPQPAGMAGV